MEQFLQALASGLAIGSIYALIALSLVLLYRTTNILNFAHGEFGLLGSFLAFYLLTLFKLPYGLSFILSLLAALLLGGFISLLLLNPGKVALSTGLGILLTALAYGLSLGLWLAAVIGSLAGILAYIFFHEGKQKPSELGLIILTLGVNLALQGFYSLAFGNDNKILPPLIADTTVRVGGAALSRLSLLTSLVGVLMMGLLWLLLNKTKIGLAMRAVAQREDVARAMGIPVKAVMFATWGVSAVLAAAAALLLAPSTLLAPTMMFEPLSKGFVAGVIGGMNSLPGAIVGGYVLGVLELLVGVYVSNEFKASFAFLVVIIVLVLRPHGLLGKAQVRRV
ncbi:MAG: branched-chain amino acid ABC transporter permease [Deinococcales bacterium]